jgi:hypothetical protein
MVSSAGTHFAKVQMVTNEKTYIFRSKEKKFAKGIK